MRFTLSELLQLGTPAPKQRLVSQETLLKYANRVQLLMFIKTQAKRKDTATTATTAR